MNYNQKFYLKNKIQIKIILEKQLAYAEVILYARPVKAYDQTFGSEEYILLKDENIV